jgi:hypothetical protein
MVIDLNERTRPTIDLGDTGADVEYLQTTIGIPADGDFGAITEAGVKGFQVACDLSDDGIVGPQTWEQVDALARRMADGEDGLPEGMKVLIADVAHTSAINRFEWDDRGNSPPGYIAGMGMSFALALTWLLDRSPIGVEMAKAAGDSDDDALALYEDEFDSIDMDVDSAGPETLRALFVLLIGLGMRESSGRYCEGRDRDATNTSSDTCEAGLFQTSFNIASASPHIPALLEDYWADPQGFLEVFDVDVNPSASDLECCGTSGSDGVRYQWLAKYSPAFATMVTALGLRHRRSHWGPIGRMEVEVVGEANEFLTAVQRLVVEQRQ